MRNMTKRAAVWLILLAATIGGCSKEETRGISLSPSAAVEPAPHVEPAPRAAPASASSPIATAVVAKHDCPKGTTGEGSSDRPCEAKGAARLMEVTWTGKMDESGPTFRVTNKSPQTILYGKLAVYFYDKAGKQLSVQDTAATPPKAVPYKSCSGRIFSGVMKPDERAVLSFSCVTKDSVPEGTAAIESEMKTVGFADATGENIDYYWTNPNLASDERKKGGVK